MSTTKRLILTTGDSGAGALKVAGLADCVIDIGWRFVWGKLRSPVELDTWLSSRPVAHEDTDFHWLSHRTIPPYQKTRASGSAPEPQDPQTSPPSE